MCIMSDQSLPNQQSAFLTLEEAATYSGISSRTLRRAVKARMIAHHRPGLSERGKILIRRSDLESYLAHSRVASI